MTKTLTFRKASSSSKSPVRTPDTLVSTDTVEILLGITEGPAAGLVDGPKTFYADGTPLVGTGGDTNFKNFALDVYPGSETGHTIAMELGGFSSPINIGVNLASGVPVTRTGVVAGIDCIDFRVVVQQLLKNNDQGSFTNSLQIKFEIKKTTDASWQPAWTSSPSTDPDIYTGPDGTTQSWSLFDRIFKSASFEGDQQAITLAAAPTVPPPIPTQDAVALVGATTVSDVYHWDSEDGTWAPITVTPADSRYDTLPSGQRIYKLSNTAPPDARIGDMWYSPVGLLVSNYKVVIWNGTAWVKPNEFGAPPSLTTPDGVWSINEKVSSATPKDIRIFLPDANPGDVWEYRVTKLSPETTSTDFTEVSWEGVQEITRSPMTFYGLAMAKIIGRASDQFTSLPTWESDWKGRIVKVPVNYDPIARTYTGVWDGTYKLAWTNCTAWIFQDFIENTRYGLSSVFPQTVNKWKIYEWAKVCDGMVLRPDGSLRPRWTYNEWITTARDSKEMAEYIAGSAGAKYVDDGNGVVEVVIDKDDPAVAIFTVENVGKDGFSYSYTDRLTRANEITVEFINPNLNWGRDKRIVRDTADIATYGRIPDNFIAVACTDLDEALARARRRLIGGLTEKEIVTFSTNRKGRYLAEWDVILVGDQDMGRGLTGRIRAITGASSVSLRDPVSLEPGITYWATFDVVDPAYPATSSSPFKTERRQITNAAGPNQTSLTFASALPALPEYAAFVIEAPEVLGFPKPYRITNISNDGGTGEKIVITALELNRNKFAYIDTAIDQGLIQYSNFQTTTVAPATSPQMEVYNRLKGSVTTRVARVFWGKSTYAWVRRYKVFHSVNGAPAGAVDTNNLEVEFEGLENGIHTFAIVAIDVRGRESLPVNVSCNLTGASRPVNGPTNLTLVGGLTSSTFNTLDATFAWDAAEPSPNFKNYQVNVLDTVSGTIIHSENVGASLTWTYNFYTNQVESGGIPRRMFKVQIVAFDDDLNQSAPIELTASNNAPAAPTVTYSATIGGVVITIASSVETDVLGAYVWLSSTNGFNPATETPTTSGNQSSFYLPLASGLTKYVRVAYYDQFSQSSVGLNYSTQLTVASSLVTVGDIDTTPPGVPTGLVLSSALSLDTDGTQKIKLTASWTANTETDLGSYVLALKEGTGNFIEFPVNGPTYEVYVKANTLYTGKVLAKDKVGNPSAYSGTVTHTTTVDTTAPSAPTSVAVAQFIGALWVSWTNPSDADLDHVEIWRNTTNDSTTAAKISEVNASPGGQGRFTFSTSSATTIYFWVKAVDTSGNASGFSSVASGTTVLIGNADLGPGTVTADKMFIGSGDNLAVNPTSELTTYTSGYGGNNVFAAAAGQGYAGDRVRRQIRSGSDPSFDFGEAPCSPGDQFYIEGWVKAFSGAANAGVWAYFMDAAGGGLTGTVLNALGSASGAWVKTYSTHVAPANAVKVVFYGYANTANGTTYYDALYARKMLTGKLVVDGEIVTQHITVGTLNGDRILIDSLDANKIKASTILANTIMVDGTALGTIQTRASDPATRINTQSTQIDPGRILISGGTSLANWRNGTDATKIEGGSIYANTINANSLKIGSRGVSFLALDFSVNAAKTLMSWSAGVVTYVNDAGAQAALGISAGSTAYTPNIYIYWVKDATALSTTTSYTTATSANNVLLCSWYGGGNFSATQGAGTIITDDRIVTGSVTAQVLRAQTITSDLVATNTLSARVLVSSNPDDIVPDADKRDAGWWTGGGGTANGLYVGSLGSGWTVGGDRAIAVNNGSTDAYSQFFQVEPGATYRVRARIWNNVGGWSGYFYPLIHMPTYQWFSLKHGYAVDPSTHDAANAIVATADTGDLEWVVVNPTTVSQWQFRMYGSFSGGPAYVQVSIVRMNDTTLIMDGSITTNKITVNTLNGDRIQANTILASKLSVTQLSAITADLGAITAGSVNIGGGLFSVSTAGAVVIKSAASGQRVEITNSLIQIFDSAGTLRVRLGIW